MEIFLFFSCILHTFDLKLPEGHSLPNLEGYFGTTLTPASYKVGTILNPLSYMAVRCLKFLKKLDGIVNTLYLPYSQVEMVERPFDVDMDFSQSLPECFATKKMSAGSH